MRFKNETEFNEFMIKRRADATEGKFKEPAPVNKPAPVQSAPGYRSNLEAAFANLLGLCKRAGRIKDWKYEPIKLKLHIKSYLKDGRERIGSVYYIPDFMVTHNDGSIEMIETKGYLRKAAELKYYEAVEKYDCFSWRMVKQENGAWVNMHLSGEDILFK